MARGQKVVKKGWVEKDVTIENHESFI